MRVNTRLFGEIDIEDEKIITMEKGIVGFPELKKFTLIFDRDKDQEQATALMWFQSLDEPHFAMPVSSPNSVKPDYDPTVNDELLAPLGELTEDNLFVLVTIKVPQDMTKMTVNLKAPIIINTDTMKGGQLIVEDNFDVRFPIYEILKKAKEEAGE